MDTQKTRYTYRGLSGHSSCGTGNFALHSLDFRPRLTNIRQDCITKVMQMCSKYYFGGMYFPVQNLICSGKLLESYEKQHSPLLFITLHQGAWVFQWNHPWALICRIVAYRAAQQRTLLYYPTPK